MASTRVAANSDKSENGPIAFGIGLVTTDQQLEILEAFFPCPIYRPGKALWAKLAEILDYTGENASIPLRFEKILALCELFREEADGAKQVSFLDQLHGIPRRAVACFIEADKPPTSVPEVYLKLTLLSARLSRPHELTLTGLFKILPTVAWTSEGPVPLQELDQRRIQARLEGRSLHVHSVDKFPPMADYIVPSEVRIADASRVRLGAHLGAGTTVMHEGFVNFNAGTSGPNMVEGRISAGVTVDSGTDIGGGASIMGTLSGGNEQVISIGKDCLVGANAGAGIPLGNNCIIEAGLYITAGAKVEILNEAGEPVNTLRARELAGESNLLFRRDSQSGKIQALPNNRQTTLNEELHSNN